MMEKMAAAQNVASVVTPVEPEKEEKKIVGGKSATRGRKKTIITDTSDEK
jgi:hypothetical protein